MAAAAAAAAAAADPSKLIQSLKNEIAAAAIRITPARDVAKYIEDEIMKKYKDVKIGLNNLKNLIDNHQQLILTEQDIKDLELNYIEAKKFLDEKLFFMDKEDRNAKYSLAAISYQDKLDKINKEKNEKYKKFSNNLEKYKKEHKSLRNKLTPLLDEIQKKINPSEIEESDSEMIDLLFSVFKNYSKNTKTYSEYKKDSG